MDKNLPPPDASCSVSVFLLSVDVVINFHFIHVVVIIVVAAVGTRKNTSNVYNILCQASMVTGVNSRATATTSPTLYISTNADLSKINILSKILSQLEVGANNCHSNVFYVTIYDATFPTCVMTYIQEPVNNFSG